MAKEHHCPNCGAQPCNASTSKIHTCGVCAAVWEEVLSETPPAPKAAAAPPTPPPAAPAKPATPAAPAPPRPAPPANPPAPSPAPAPRAEDGPPPRGKRLSDVVAAAKVKRC